MLNVDWLTDKAYDNTVSCVCRLISPNALWVLLIVTSFVLALSVEFSDFFTVSTLILLKNEER